MKIFVSSQHFASFLNDIDVNSIENVRVKHGRLFIRSKDKSSSIYVESQEKESEDINQENTRWDWIKKDLNSISERPIVIEFLENKANIILNY